MPDAQGNAGAAEFGIGVPVPNPVYTLKGSNNYDWGMKDRLSRIFNPSTGHTVMLETNGSLPLDSVPPQVTVVMDLKSPGSGMAASNRWTNLTRLKPTDEVKIVCRGREDYLWSRSALREHGLLGRVRVSLSPVWGELDAADLARWILEDRLNLRLQLISTPR